MRINYSTREVSDIVGGSHYGKSNSFIKSLVTDTRNYIYSEQPMFIALKGRKQDGHQFIHDAYKKGIRNFLVSENNFSNLKNANFIVVKDTLASLQSWATHHRSIFNIPIIAITGSNGKTIIKEWLYHFLRTRHNIIRSPKSYNSQLGVALSLLMINKDHDLAIIEVGISEPGDMSQLKKMIQPTHAILTNLGSIHAENFNSASDHHKEKLSLLEGTSAFGPSLHFQKINYFNNHGHLLKVTKLKTFSNCQKITFNWKGKEYIAEIPHKDYASAHNISTCINFLLIWGLPINEILELCKTIPSIALRMGKRKGFDNSIIIDDSYNSDLVSIHMALEHLVKESGNRKRIVILSDILTDKADANKLYKEIALWIKSHKIDLFIGIGIQISAHKHLFKSSSFYDSTASFLKELHLYSFKESAILIKGTRSFSFEKIARSLEKKSHETILTINLKSLYKNFVHYRNLTPKNVKILCMIKASGYGAGIIEIAKKLCEAKPDYFGVAYTDEGIELRENNIQLPILVMNPEINSFDDIIKNKLTPSIYSLEQMDLFIRKLIDLNERQYPIHLKFDTGMHRLGFTSSEINAVCDLILNQPEIRVEGVFSHLASSDSENDDPYTLKQLSDFDKLCQTTEEILGYSVNKHILNTSGIERFKNQSFDMVRLGLGLYGISSFNKNKVTPIASLTSSISQIKSINKGESIGYNRGQKLKRDSKIGVIPIGYADGYSRLLSNGKGKVFVNECMVPTIGKICMDMTMLDLTDVDAQVGDAVEIFGPNHTIAELAEELQTIPYEILSSISERVVRIYIEE